jgi:predicted nucleotidyltransferase
MTRHHSQSTNIYPAQRGPCKGATPDVEGIAEAYIHGSWAARYRGEPGPAPADVDVLVIGTADPDSLDDATEQAQRTLHRPVNIRRVRPETWRAASPADPFLQSVKTRPLVSIGRSTA